MVSRKGRARLGPPCGVIITRGQPDLSIFPIVSVEYTPAISPGATTGHPIAHQPVEVKPVPPSTATDAGFTGSKGRKITASLGPAASTVVGSFTNYFVTKNIPANIAVPCSGSGTAVFTPSPTSKTARPATLSVTFLNIGA